MFTVTKATVPECIDILSEPRLLAILPKSPALEELPSYLAASNYYLLSYKKHKLLFEYFLVREGVYEFHIACPTSSIIASRVLCLGLLKYLFTTSELDTKALITTCPEGKIANLIRKLGGNYIGSVENNLQFIMTSKRYSACHTNT